MVENLSFNNSGYWLQCNSFSSPSEFSLYFLLVTYSAVSYTHLDVYKRQVSKHIYNLQNKKYILVKSCITINNIKYKTRIIEHFYEYNIYMCDIIYNNKFT